MDFLTAAIALNIQDQAFEVSDVSHTVAVTFPYQVIHSVYIPAHDMTYLTYLVCNSSCTVAN